MDGWNHKVNVTKGVLEEECSYLMVQFCRELRKRLKAEKEAAKAAEAVTNPKNA